MRVKVRRKMKWDEHGVSEIIADILILAMTVVLFAIIFAFVWTLPAPNESTYADLEGDIELDPVGVTIYVNHLSGEDLRGSYTEIYLYKNVNEKIKILSTKGSPGDDPDNPWGYGLEDDDTWSPGETWTFYMVGVDSSDELEIKVWDSQVNFVVHSQKLLGAGVNDAPFVMERWYSPAPAMNASAVTISANVMDPDGWGDISANGSVYVDISQINKTYTTASMNMVSHTGTRILAQTAPIVIDKGEGTFTLTITVVDATGLKDTGRIVLNIGDTAKNAPQIRERWSIPEVGVNGTDITIYARVIDEDGYGNIDFPVMVDIGNLTNGTPVWLGMTDPEQDSIFERTVSPINVSLGDMYRVNFHVTDITGLEDSDYLDINVKSFNPVIARTWTVNQTGKDEEYIYVYAEVSDPDGYSDISDVWVNLSELNPAFEWVQMVDLEQDGIFESSVLIDVVAGGNKTLNFVARDNEGNDVAATMKVFVTTKMPPVILERWTNPHFPDNGSEVSIFARVIDPDGYEDLDYVQVNITALDRTLAENNTWTWVNMIDPNQDGNFINVTLVDREAGAYMIEFRAFDKGNNSAYATLNLTILPFRPRFLNVWTNPTIGRNGSSIQIYANVMDPNGYADIDTVTVDIVQLNQSLNQSDPMWMEMVDFNRNGTFLNVTMINVDETGIYILNFTVRDLDGNEATISHELIVTSYKPSIIQTWYSPSPAINGTNVTIYAWLWDDDGADDIASVMINVSALNSTLTWVNMTDPEEDGVFTVQTLIDAVNVSAVYNVTIEAFDTTGNPVNKTVGIQVDLTPPPSGEEDMVFIGDVTPNGVGSQGNIYCSAITKNGTTPNKRIAQVRVRVQWQGGWHYLTRMFDWYYKLLSPPHIIADSTSAGNIYRTVYFEALNDTGATIAYDNITLLILFDESGGEVKKGTALEQNVAWIANDQGFVITNNKTSNAMVQIFDINIVPKNEHVWVKIGSNTITNTEKTNIFQLRSRSTGKIVANFSSPVKQFEYDGVLAGYWFFVLDFSAVDLWNWQRANIPGNPVSEYYYIYMKIKDTTDDYFATNSWIVVHNGSLGSYPKTELLYDPGYIPGGGTFVDVNDDGLDDSISVVAEPLEHIYNSTDYIYVKIYTKSVQSPPTDATFDNLELQDFHGNQIISGGEGSPSGVPLNQKIITPVGIDGTNYTIGINLLRADKDPWLIGENAYTIIIRNFRDDDENVSYIAIPCMIKSPASIMDIVIGHDDSGGPTSEDQYHGQYYENMNGYFNFYAYAWVSGGSGQLDYIGDINSVDFEDVDDDDDRDIICGREGYKSGGGKDFYYTFSIYWNLGNGYFDEEVINDSLPGDPYSVVAGEVDYGNDALDIVVGCSNGDVFVFYNDGYWTQVMITDNQNGGDVDDPQDKGHTIEIADLDGDGDGDVAVGTDDGLKIFRNNGVSSWENVINFNPGEVVSITIDLISNDAYPDIIVGTAGSDIYKVINTDGDIGSLQLVVVAEDINGANPVFLDVGNIDGVGYPDIVAGAGGKIMVYNTFDGGSSWNQNISNVDGGFPTGRSITALEVGNIDGAIEDDIAVATDQLSTGQPKTEHGGKVLMYRNLGRATGSIAEGHWKRFEVDDLIRYNLGGMHINCLAIGDANLGNA
ncbi:MAG: type IV pilin N-terminal domain-containing protein [Thermoplasmata archaeon]|nr:MAG: type IV pilin N-terminal domain-containing protein [Thermoplasmata archaeon]